MEQHTQQKLDFEKIRQWKLIDIRLQVAAFVVPFLIACFTAEPAAIAIAYFTVGGVQVVSCIVHSIYQHKKLYWHTRKYYETTLIGIFAIGILLAFFPEAFMVFAAIMLIAGLFLAIWYFAFITLGEYDLIKSVLKAKQDEDEQAVVPEILH